MDESERTNQPENPTPFVGYEKPEVRDLGSLLDLTNGVPNVIGPDSFNIGSQ